MFASGTYTIIKKDVVYENKIIKRNRGLPIENVSKGKEKDGEMSMFNSEYEWAGERRNYHF